VHAAKQLSVRSENPGRSYDLHLETLCRAGHQPPDALDQPAWSRRWLKGRNFTTQHTLVPGCRRTALALPVHRSKMGHLSRSHDDGAAT
jgi:hypothetical protein